MSDTSLSWVHEISASFPKWSFEAFHRDTVGGLLLRRRELIEEDIRDAAPIALQRPDGLTFTYRAGSDGVSVVEGDASAHTLVEIDDETFSDFANELLTASGTISTQRAKILRGDLPGWQRWEPALRALITGRPIYGTGATTDLRDPDGAPLDLGRSFTLGDSDETLAAFLATAGFLHLRGVFGADEIEMLRAEVERGRAATTPGDGSSWWSLNAAGEEVVTRINYLDRFSDRLAQFGFDERLYRIARLIGPDMRVCDDRLDGPMVFIKNPNVVKGNGDLGWHVDDGSGGHSVMCPLLQLGIQLDPANAANGTVKLLAGSHRCASHWIGWGEEGDLPVVEFETEPGDLTVHFGDTMHTTPPPTSPDAGRRVLYYKFAEPKTFDWIPPHCHYNDWQFGRDAAGRVATRATTWNDDREPGERYR